MDCPIRSSHGFSHDFPMVLNNSPPGRSPTFAPRMSNPEMLRAMVRMNPQLNELMEQRPEIARMLEDPELLQQSLRHPVLGGGRSAWRWGGTIWEFHRRITVLVGYKWAMFNSKLLNDQSGTDSASVWYVIRQLKCVNFSLGAGRSCFCADLGRWSLMKYLAVGVLDGDCSKNHVHADCCVNYSESFSTIFVCVYVPMFLMKPLNSVLIVSTSPYSNHSSASPAQRDDDPPNSSFFRGDFNSMKVELSQVMPTVGDFNTFSFLHGI